MCRIKLNKEKYKLCKYKWNYDLKFPKIPRKFEIAPTYASAWSFNEIKNRNKEVYTPIYKLPPFKQDIELKWTEYAEKYGVFINI